MTLKEQISKELKQAEESILDKFRYIIKSEGYDIEKCNSEGVHYKLFREIRKAVIETLDWKVGDKFLHKKFSKSKEQLPFEETYIIMAINLHWSATRNHYITYHTEVFSKRNEEFHNFISFNSLENFQIPKTDTFYTFDKI